MRTQGKILVVSFQSLTERSAGGMARLGYYVSEQLHKRGLLEQFVVFSKGKYKTSFPSVPVSKWSRYYLYILNKLNKFLKLPDHKFRLIQEHLYDQLCQKHISRDTSILFTTNAHMKRTFAKAKKLGIPIIYVPANPEENYIYKLVKEEEQKLNIHEEEPYTYKPRLRFYNESVPYIDTVIGTYPTVYESYKQAAKEYRLVQINGHLKPDFKPYTYRERHAGDTFNVVYIATTVPLKGLQYLLDAWQQLMQEKENNEALQLHIVGRIEPAVKKHIEQHLSEIPNVHYTGRVPDVTAFLQQIDLCVVPSLTDGGPYVALEAAHYGVPVVLTKNCGSAELLSRKENGCKVIPIRDAIAIKDAIQWGYYNKHAARRMGKTGKDILDNYDMTEFIINITDYLEKRLAETK